MAEATDRDRGSAWIRSGFIAKSIWQGLLGVRNVVVVGVYSPTPAHREALARKADAMDLGPCKPFGQPGGHGDLRRGGCAVYPGANFARLTSCGRSMGCRRAARALVGVACEKPCAHVAEARRDAAAR